jgi:hypothetical protein
VAEATARAAEGFGFVDLGAIDLRGRSAATRVYALHIAAAGDPSFTEFLGLHGRVLAAAQARPEAVSDDAADLAAAIAAALADKHGARYQRFYAALARRAPPESEPDYSLGGS